MLSLITNGLIAILERELVAYEPLIQQFLIHELDKAIQLLVQFVENKKQGQ
ncbi:hypothetical protein [Legionella micdadei]|uniref:Uncharacterized protein n=1 Tax=Legionella micdadei TaxID=451 RepID=A0A098GG42_LEGMI|nr:hypothetical protein [Legionella micdadei]KTD27556.1 hypothetical protein Lmic_1876 [Legionella micdadei]CEG60955.1 protein of unknown function [Legionella micdadei]SCY69479.1 hypothetical protein SAMN02982997_02526 [Legionella micdadei]